MEYDCYWEQIAQRAAHVDQFIISALKNCGSSDTCPAFIVEQWEMLCAQRDLYMQVGFFFLMGTSLTNVHHFTCTKENGLLNFPENQNVPSERETVLLNCRTFILELQHSRLSVYFNWVLGKRRKRALQQAIWAGAVHHTGLWLQLEGFRATDLDGLMLTASTCCAFRLEKTFPTNQVAHLLYIQMWRLWYTNKLTSLWVRRLKPQLSHSPFMHLITELDAT